MACHGKEEGGGGGWGAWRESRIILEREKERDGGTEIERERENVCLCLREREREERRALEFLWLSQREREGGSVYKQGARGARNGSREGGGHL